MSALLVTVGCATTEGPPASALTDASAAEAAVPDDAATRAAIPPDAGTRDAEIDHASRDTSPPDALAAPHASTGPLTCEVLTHLRLENCRQSDAPPPLLTPQVITETSIGPGANGAACPITPRPALVVGTFPGLGIAPRPVMNGVREGGSLVTVDCGVVPDDDGGAALRVTGVVTKEAGVGVERLTVEGVLTAALTPQPGIRLTLESELGRFEQTGCVGTYTRAASPPIAPGRVWIEIACPRADRP